MPKLPLKIENENVHRFALRAIRGELFEREREKERDPHNELL